MSERFAVGLNLGEKANNGLVVQLEKDMSEDIPRA